MATATRKVADCRKFPSENNCTLTIAGSEEEVVKAATEHAISAHGHKDTPELRAQIRGMLATE
ncbi:MAG: DUF1059 domain-containing protein [Candidatus Eremiobacteraeota bacterium]|nr:DUF1059 domain-containing protein [Candidatus Eremiobacteraeota bacterium]